MHVDLTGLPLKIHNRKPCIDWQRSTHHKIPFAYKEEKGSFLIVDVLSDGKHIDLLLKYNNKIAKISSYNLMHNNLKRLMDKFHGDYVFGFRYGINENISDSKRNMTIIKRYKRGVFNNKIVYGYICNKCGYSQGVITQDALMMGKGCSCCNNKIVVEGINDIPTTAEWMIKFFQKGKEEAKKYTKCSSKCLYFVCPDCGVVRNKRISINRLYKTHSIGCGCGDGYSYPEKVMFNILKTLDIDFVYQFSPKWAQGFKGSKRAAIYDFAIPSMNLIIEMDGGIGHGKYVFPKSIRTIQETKDKDDWKDCQAKNNGYEVIRIESDFSNIEYLKANILNFVLSKYFSFDNLGWAEIDKKSAKNIVKEICSFYNDKQGSVKQLSSHFNISISTVRKYLKKGNSFGWINNSIKQKSVTTIP